LFSLKSKIAVIGSGKISYSLVNALKRSGFEITVVISKKKSSAKKLADKFKIKNYSDKLSAIPFDCKVFFLSVPDNELKKLAANLAKQKLDFANSVFIHLSGAEDISVLNLLKKTKAKTASIHIMQSFPSKQIVNIQNCYSAIETTNKVVEKFLSKLAGKLKLKPFKITSANKVFYHMAGVYSSNYLVANLFNTKELFKKTNAGINFEEVYAPIITSTLNNVSSFGVENSLSGPIERGDLKTIKKHIKNLNFDKSLKSNYINQAITLLDLIKKREGKLSAKHSELKSFLISLKK